jgi:uncharacterized delta-60 repeat protein
LARLNSDGTFDTTFKSRFAASTTFASNTAMKLSSGKYLFLGNFTSYGGVTVNRILRTNSDGSNDTVESNILVKGGVITYDSSYSSSKLGPNSLAPRTYVDNYIKASNGIIKASDKLVLGGTFTRDTRISGQYIASISASDNALYNTQSKGIRTNDYLYSAVPISSAAYGIGSGLFAATSSYNGMSKVMVFNGPDGKYMNTVFTCLSGDVYKIINGGSVMYCVGDFQQIENNGSNTPIIKNGIVAINTISISSSLQSGYGFTGGGAYDILMDVNNKLLVAGGFTSYQNVSAPRIIRLNNDGSVDTTFNAGTGFDNVVYALAIQDDGKILVAGEPFTEYDGNPVGSIVRLNSDGSLDESFNMGLAENSDGFSTAQIYSISVQDDGKILVGGYFDIFSGVTVSGLVRLNSNGSLDESFTPPVFDYPGVSTVHIDNDVNKIYVGGQFNSFGTGTTSTCLIVLNMDGTPYNTFQENFNGLNDVFFGIGDVSCIIENNYQNGVLVCGQFTQIDTGVNQIDLGCLLSINEDGTVSNPTSKITVTDKMIYQTVDVTTLENAAIPNVEYVKKLIATPRIKIRQVTGDTITTSTDYLLLVNTSTSGKVIGLRTDPEDGEVIVIKDKSNNGNVNNIIIGGNGKTIDGGSDALINTNGGSYAFAYSAADNGWYSIGMII